MINATQSALIIVITLIFVINIIHSIWEKEIIIIKKVVHFDENMYVMLVSIVLSEECNVGREKDQ